MTLCEQCGASRETIPAACPACGFQPTTRRELAVAALLTETFGEGGGERPFGTPADLLARYGKDLREGRRPALDEADLRRHERALSDFLDHEPNLLRGLLALFAPRAPVPGRLARPLAAAPHAVSRGGFRISHLATRRGSRCLRPGSLTSSSTRRSSRCPSTTSAWPGWTATGST